MKTANLSRGLRKQVAAIPPRMRSCPDGLTEPAINALIQDVYREIADAPRPTSALLDGTAAERRRRRTARRAIASVIRALPARPVSEVLDGEAA